MTDKSAREWAAWFSGMTEKERVEVAAVVLFNAEGNNRCVQEGHTDELRRLRHKMAAMLPVPERLFEVQSPASWLHWFDGLAPEDREHAARAIMAGSQCAHRCRTQHKHFDDILNTINKIRELTDGLDV